jgi:hypothetical protein
MLASTKDLFSAKEGGLPGEGSDDQANCQHSTPYLIHQTSLTLHWRVYAYCIIPLVKPPLQFPVGAHGSGHPESCPNRIDWRPYVLETVSKNLLSWMKEFWKISQAVRHTRCLPVRGCSIYPSAGLRFSNLGRSCKSQELLPHMYSTAKMDSYVVHLSCTSKRAPGDAFADRGSYINPSAAREVLVPSSHSN